MCINENLEIRPDKELLQLLTERKNFFKFDEKRMLIDCYYKLGLFSFYEDDLKQLYKESDFIEKETIEEEERDRIVNLRIDFALDAINSDFEISIQSFKIEWLVTLIDICFKLNSYDKTKSKKLMLYIETFVIKHPNKVLLLLSMLNEPDKNIIKRCADLLRDIDKNNGTDFLECYFRASILLCNDQTIKNLTSNELLKLFINEKRFIEFNEHLLVLSRKPFLVEFQDIINEYYNFTKYFNIENPNNLIEWMDKNLDKIKIIGNSYSSFGKLVMHFTQLNVDGYEVSFDEIKMLMILCDEELKLKNNKAINHYSEKQVQLIKLFQDSSFLDASSILCELSILYGYHGNTIEKYRKLVNFQDVVPNKIGPYQLAEALNDILGEYEKALLICENAIQIKTYNANDYDYINIINMMYEIYMKINDYEKALVCIEKIATTPHQRNLYIHALIMNNKDSRLLDELRTTLDETPNSHTAEIIKVISKYFISIENWIILYDVLVSSQNRSNVVLEIIWNIAIDKEDIFTLIFWKDEQGTNYELTQEQRNARNEGIEKMVKGVIRELSHDFESGIKKIKQKANLFERVSQDNPVTTILRNNVDRTHMTEEATQYKEENDLSKHENSKFLIFFKYWLMKPDSFDFLSDIPIKMANFRTYDYMYWGLTSCSSVNITYQLFKIGIEKIENSTDHKSNFRFLNSNFYFHFIYFLARNQDLRKCKQIHFDRAYYYAKCILTGAVANVKFEDEKLVKEFSKNFLNALTTLNMNTFYDIEDKEKINEGKKVFKDLLENKYFTKLSSFSNMKEQIEKFIECEYLINYKEYDLLVNDTEKKKYLLRHLRLKNFEFVEDVLNSNYSTENNPFLIAVKKYIDNYKDEHPYSNEFIDILDDGIEKRRNENIIKYSKKLIIGQHFDQCLEFLTLMVDLFKESSELAYYKDLSYFLVLQSKKQSCEQELEKLETIVISIFKSINLCDITTMHYDVLSTTILMSIANGYSYRCEKLIKIIEYVLKRDNYDNLLSNEYYYYIDRVITSKNEIIKNLDYINEIFHKTDAFNAFIKTICFGSVEDLYPQLKEHMFILSDPIVQQLLDLIIREKSRKFKLLLLTSSTQTIDINDIFTGYSELPAAINNLDVRDIFITEDEFRKTIDQTIKSKTAETDKVNRLNNYLVIAQYIFDWSRFSLLVEDVIIKNKLIDDKNKLDIINLYEQKQTDMNLEYSHTSHNFILTKSHIFFKTNDYIKAYNLFNKVERHIVNKNQVLNNNYLLSALLSGMKGIEILNGTHSQLKSFVRRCITDGREEIKNIIIESKNEVLIRVWKINELTIESNFKLAERENFELMQISPRHGEYYSDKIADWKRKKHLGSDSSYQINEKFDLPESPFEVFKQYIHLYEHLVIVLSEIYTHQKIEYKEIRCITDVHDRNRAYIYWFSNEIKNNKLPTKEFNDYLNFLFNNYLEFDNDSAINIYCDGLKYFSDYYDNLYEDDLIFFVDLYIKLLSNCKDIKSIEENTTQIFAASSNLADKIQTKLQRYNIFDDLKFYEKEEYYGKIKIVNDIIDKISSLNMLDKYKHFNSKVIDILMKEIKEINIKYLESNDKPFDFFISYSRRDYDYVLSIKEGLEKNKLTVWMDYVSLRADARYYTTQIYDAIDKSKFVLMFLSKNVIEVHDNIFHLEFHPALDMKSKILPIWIEKMITPNEVDQTRNNRDKFIEVKEMLTFLNKHESVIENIRDKEDLITLILKKTFGYKKIR